MCVGGNGPGAASSGSGLAAACEVCFPFLDFFCSFSQSIFDALLRYVDRFWALYDHLPKMTYLAVMDAHEPSLARVRSLDRSLADLLRRLTSTSEDPGRGGEEGGWLAKGRGGQGAVTGGGGWGGGGGGGGRATERETVVILAGDHGMSYGEWFSV